MVTLMRASFLKALAAAAVLSLGAASGLAFPSHVQAAGGYLALRPNAAARFAEAEKKLKAKYGKGWDEMFPPEEYYQVMHLKLFPRKLVHAENVGGDIDKISNQRAWIAAARITR